MRCALSEQRLGPFATEIRNMNIETFNEEQASQHDAALSRFASSLGTTSDSSPGPGASASSFIQYLSPSVAGDAVVCSLPSLDMSPPSEPSEGGGESPLPELGEHREKVPEMAASVLISAATATSNAALLEQHAAVQLGTLTSWTKSSLIYAPHAINRNISGAISSLIDSRVRAWTLLLLRHSLTTGDKASRSRLLSMLSCAIKLKSTTTTFKTLPMPPSARRHPKEADAILPLLFEAQLKLSIEDKEDTVSLRAPGTIAGIFAKDGTTGVTRVDVRLDTGALLESMIEQARLAVFKAVARATSVTARPTIPLTSAPAEPTTLQGFSSSLSIASIADATPTITKDAPSQPQSTQLLKARSSALRLSNILYGKSDEADKGMTNAPLSKTRKNRSVRWDSPMEIPSRDVAHFPTPKRQRMVKSQLRSTKSFGRPHAEHGSGPRNATFGEFGSTTVTWGKDGKLKNHPVPEGGLMAWRMSTFENTAASTQNRNAMFDLQQKTNVSVETLSALGVGRIPQTSGTNMPRTATALENWLVNATKGGAASGLQ